jgi:hypothetical protein
MINENKLYTLKYFENTCKESESHLYELVENATTKITLFGLTRNFYAESIMQRILIEKSKKIPIRVYFLNPFSKFWKERYELEPKTAKFHDKNKFILVLNKFQHMEDITKNYNGGIKVCIYEFQPSFAIEEIDYTMRVMLYGYLKRGTESPIFIINTKDYIYNYFKDQLIDLSKKNDLKTIDDILLKKDA